ncbi:UNVERIFIED_CONTAM: hypothetical protein K2H54_058306 [Gekko kuhli]
MIKVAQESLIFVHACLIHPTVDHDERDRRGQCQHCTGNHDWSAYNHGKSARYHWDIVGFDNRHHDA